MSESVFVQCCQKNEGDQALETQDNYMNINGEGLALSDSFLLRERDNPGGGNKALSAAMNENQV